MAEDQKPDAGERMLPCLRVVSVLSHAIVDNGQHVDVLVRGPTGADTILRIETIGFGMWFAVMEKIAQHLVGAGVKAPAGQVAAYKLDDYELRTPDDGVPGVFLVLNPSSAARQIAYLIDDDQKAKDMGAAIVRLAFDRLRRIKQLVRPARQVLAPGRGQNGSGA
jgi:hypothetical protein